MEVVCYMEDVRRIGIYFRFTSLISSRMFTGSGEDERIESWAIFTERGYFFS